MYIVHIPVEYFAYTYISEVYLILLKSRSSLIPILYTMFVVVPTFEMKLEEKGSGSSHWPNSKGLPCPSPQSTTTGTWSTCAGILMRPFTGPNMPVDSQFLSGRTERPIGLKEPVPTKRAPLPRA